MILSIKNGDLVCGKEIKVSGVHSEVEYVDINLANVHVIFFRPDCVDFHFYSNDYVKIIMTRQQWDTILQRAAWQMQQKGGILS